MKRGSNFRLVIFLHFLQSLILFPTFVHSSTNTYTHSSTNTHAQSTTQRALHTLLLDDSNISLNQHPSPTSYYSRNLYALPIPKSFNPPPGHFSRGKLQDGDKCCLPPTYWKAIQSNDVEVPWVVRISRIDDEKDVYREGGMELRTMKRVNKPVVIKGPRDMVGER